MNAHVKSFLAALLGLASAALSHAAPSLEIQALQRYPWNGMVDLQCTLSNPHGAQVQAFTVADAASGAEFPVKTLWDADGTPVDMGYDLPTGTTRMLWNAAADLPKDWKSDRMALSGDIRNYQTVAFGTPSYSPDGVSAVLSATALSGNEVTFEVVSGPGVLDGNILSFTGPEMVFVRATQAGDGDWMPASTTNGFAALYTVLDLSSGSNVSQYPVEYFATTPPDGFNKDPYKTTKLVLRRIEAGTFTMGANEPNGWSGIIYYHNTPHKVVLTKAFLIGIFEVTQKQYSLVTGGNPSYFRGDTRPVEKVSFQTIRGITNWPASSAVGTNSFMGRLRARTGISFDLPTDAQWEYACRAGTSSQFNNGGNGENAMKKVGVYEGNNPLGTRQTLTVGGYLPNAWGLYDMHGNVYEICLDRWSEFSTAAVTDPVGPASGDYRVVRGGYYDAYWYWCISFCREHTYDHDFQTYGMRLACTLSR